MRKRLAIPPPTLLLLGGRTDLRCPRPSDRKPFVRLCNGSRRKFPGSADTPGTWGTSRTAPTTSFGKALLARSRKFTRPSREMHTGPPGTSLRGWLFAILRNCHIEETRRGQRLDALTGTREASSPTTRRNQEAGPAQSELCDAYLSLSEERREALLLVAIEGLQHEEAAAILGVPLGAVRSRLSQGRHALRQALEAGRAALASPLLAHPMQAINT